MVPEILGVPLYVWGGLLILVFCACMPLISKWLYRD